MSTVRQCAFARWSFHTLEKYAACEDLRASAFAMPFVAVWPHERCSRASSRQLPPASARTAPPSSLTRDDGGEGQAGAGRDHPVLPAIRRHRACYGTRTGAASGSPVVVAGATTRCSLAFADRFASTDQRSQPSRSWMSGSIVTLLLRGGTSPEPDGLFATGNLSWARSLPAAQTCAAPGLNGKTRTDVDPFGSN